MNGQNTSGFGIPKPNGRTRVEYMTDLMSDGETTLGVAMSIADAAGKQHDYHLTHEEMWAVIEALTAAKNALPADGMGAEFIRGAALVKVEKAIAKITEATA